MKILVTGASGFLGVNVCERLLKLDHTIYGVDNNYTGSEQNLNLLLNYRNFEFSHFDVRSNWKSLPECDAIVQLACPASPKHYQRDPIFTWTTNVIGNLNALEYARKHQSRIIFSSTSEVYGDPNVPIQSEEYWGNVNPIGVRACYDEGKRAAETLLFDASRHYGVDVRIARIFNTYGPGMAIGDGRVVSNLVVQALSGIPLTVYGDGMQTRSFCYVGDTTDGLIALTLNKVVGVTPINIGNPDEVTMNTLADTILDITGSKSLIEYGELPQDDPKSRRPDISRARRQLHWDPKTNLREGLTQTVNYFRTLIG